MDDSGHIRNASLFFFCQTSMLNWIHLPCVCAYSVCWIYETCFWYLVFASWQMLVNLVVICGNLVISHLFWSVVSYHGRLLNWNYCLSCYFIPLVPQLFFFPQNRSFIINENTALLFTVIMVIFQHLKL